MFFSIKFIRVCPYHSKESLANSQTYQLKDLRLLDKIMQENKISSPLSLESALNFVPLIIESSVYKHL